MVRPAKGSSELAWEIVVVDDASPDGTQEVAKELANVYGEDKIVGVCSTHPVTSLNAPQLLKPRPGKLGLGFVSRFFFYSACTDGRRAGLHISMGSSFVLVTLLSSWTPTFHTM